MPFVVMVWLLLPWLLDVWLTFAIARALSIEVWVIFAVSAVVGVVLMVREWQRLQAHWQALRRMEGSPWQLLSSARRALAAFLLILPGLGSDALALLLLCWRGRGAVNATVYGSTSPAGHDEVSGDGFEPSPARPHEQTKRPHRSGGAGGNAGVIEGEYRREE